MSSEPSEITPLGFPHRHYRQTDSTNDRAKELAQLGAPSGLVVTAESQTAGRGRSGRSWFSVPGGSLLYSALIRPLGERPLLPLAIPLAVCEAAEDLTRHRCLVKWPNDVWIDERKLAGVLIEGRPDPDPSQSWAVIGIGLNLDLSGAALPEELDGRVAWLGEEIGPEAARIRLSSAIEKWLGAEDGDVLEEFRRRDLLKDRMLEWDGGSGLAKGVDDHGHLLVEIDGGEIIALGAGEVSLGSTLGGR